MGLSGFFEDLYAAPVAERARSPPPSLPVSAHCPMRARWRMTRLMPLVKFPALSHADGAPAIQIKVVSFDSSTLQSQFGFLRPPCAAVTVAVRRSADEAQRGKMISSLCRSWNCSPILNRYTL
ncbi:hypothetical protein JCGZ_12818 [Jatropha curcas]|uniref:Uncharacterized protein n=1 Tax=Jatropha curcas TaxID=180498 RepID=A0A067KR53_JATCU|nr:hypothetical protein JCGZ_12818 [Jatropha curcas]